MKKRYEVRLAGTGGQGVILAGVILAEAGVYDGLHVTQTQSYGPEARGGASRCEVVLSENEIDYPKVIRPDITLCMSQEACDRYAEQIGRGGILIIYSDHVSRAPTTRAIQVPLARISCEVTGRELSANVVGLGILASLTGIITRGSLESAVRARVPKGTSGVNLKALNAGYEAAGYFRDRRY